MLADQLSALMRKHDLTCLSINLHRRPNDQSFFWSANAQCMHDAERIGAQHIADDPRAAIEGAITKLNERRVSVVSVPVLEAA